MYKQFAILNISKNTNIINVNKRENRAYDIQMDYTKKKIIGKQFIDYLGPSYFNEIPLHLKKDIYQNVYKNSNYIINKKSIVNWLLGEL